MAGFAGDCVRGRSVCDEVLNENDDVGDEEVGCRDCALSALRVREYYQLVALGFRPETAIILVSMWTCETYARGEWGATVGYATSKLPCGDFFRKLEVRRALNPSVVDKCVCDSISTSVSDSEPAFRYLINSDYHSGFSARFGSKMLLRDYVSLPVEVINFRNLPAFGVKFDEFGDCGFSSRASISALHYWLAIEPDLDLRQGGFVRDDDGIRKDYMRGYCYAGFFLPSVRSHACALLGKAPELARIMAMPLAWFDWEAMSSLFVVQKAVALHVSTSVGVPIVPWLSGWLSGNLAGESLGRCLVAGKLEELTGSDMVVQVLTSKFAASCYKHSDLGAESARLQLVADGEFNSYSVAGLTMLSFPLGVRVKLMNKEYVELGAVGVRLVLFVRDAISFKVSDPGGTWNSREPISVRVNGSAGRTAVWLHSTLIDSKSSRARFYARTADLVVLHSPRLALDWGPRSVKEVMITDPLNHWSPWVDRRISGRWQSGLIHCFAGDDKTVLTKFRVSDPDFGLVLNGCVKLCEPDIALAFCSRVSIVPEDSSSAAVDWSYHKLSDVDDYYVDNGGLSCDVSDWSDAM